MNYVCVYIYNSKITVSTVALDDSVSPFRLLCCKRRAPNMRFHSSRQDTQPEDHMQSPATELAAPLPGGKPVLFLFISRPSPGSDKSDRLWEVATKLQLPPSRWVGNKKVETSCKPSTKAMVKMTASSTRLNLVQLLTNKVLKTIY